ncbi:hypothetical protein HMPREF3156_01446 [Neisseria sp. HMSC06F02]|nr:hypothetical protein HMPREF3156_01446 [Neisseria sp. HMSC06F02]
MPTLHAIPYRITSRRFYPQVCRKFQTTCLRTILADKPNRTAAVMPIHTQAVMTANRRPI